MTKDLSIIIPTFNEKENIYPLYKQIQSVLNRINWEIIFVDDDSPDGTASEARNIAMRDQRVRCIQRIGRKGLSSACIEGILSSSSPIVCIMDADMQHDEKIIPDMYKSILKDDVDLVIGSRYIDTGSTGSLPKYRIYISKFATWIGKMAMNHAISDPMSGFFMLKRSYFEKIMRNLSGRGFKILLDILISSDGYIKTNEIPYIMRERKKGESKLSAGIIFEFFQLILEKHLGNIFPRRFISFVIVGLSGVVVHMTTLWLLHIMWSTHFIPSQAIATYVAMTSNYILNNNFTFRDRKLHGINFFKGLLSFYLACTLGAIINLAVATLLYDRAVHWVLAGFMGAVAGAVWNYASTLTITWKERS